MWIDTFFNLYVYIRKLQMKINLENSFARRKCMCYTHIYFYTSVGITFVFSRCISLYASSSELHLLTSSPPTAERLSCCLCCCSYRKVFYSSHTVTTLTYYARKAFDVLWSSYATIYVDCIRRISAAKFSLSYFGSVYEISPCTIWHPLLSLLCKVRFFLWWFASVFSLLPSDNYCCWACHTSYSPCESGIFTHHPSYIRRPK